VVTGYGRSMFFFIIVGEAYDFDMFRQNTQKIV
jgi:hypothetical protein